MQVISQQEDAPNNENENNVPVKVSGSRKNKILKYIALIAVVTLIVITLSLGIYYGLKSRHNSKSNPSPSHSNLLNRLVFYDMN